MANEAKDKTAERLAIAIVLVFLLGFGWLTLLQGGMTLKGKSGHESFVDGRLGIATACFDFLIAALCASKAALISGRFAFDFRTGINLNNA